MTYEAPTTANVQDYVPGARVRAIDISDAAQLIDDETGWTPAQHSDDSDDGIRLLPLAMVQRCHAIVAARLAAITEDSGTPTTTAESDDGASFTMNADDVRRFHADPLYGMPRKLLRLRSGFWSRVPN